MFRNPSIALRLQELERRDAPATLIGANKVTYLDVDGDNVTVVLSKPVLTGANVATVFTFDTPFATVGPQQLQEINLTSIEGAAGTTITTVAKRNAVTGGDGFAALGEIDGTGIDLGAVKVDGDLGRIVAGDAMTATSGLKGLTVHSMGLYWDTGGGPYFDTAIQGKLGFLKVKTGVFNSSIKVEGGADGQIGSVLVGGCLYGGAGEFSGSIISTGDMGFVTIWGNVIGGGNDVTGGVFSGGKLAGVKVGGSVIGGYGTYSGQIGSIGNMGPVTIQGNLIGGHHNNSGVVYCFSTLAELTVRGDVVGGSAFGADNLSGSGFIVANRIVSLTIGGSLIAGSDGTFGTFQNNGAIRADDDLGTVLIKGSIEAGFGGNPAIISARGQATPTSTSDVAIGKLTVGGDVNGVLILAGVDANGVARNADAQIGTVYVGGDWIVSSIAAGVDPGPGGFFGDGDDTKMSGGVVNDNPAMYSSIKSLIIGGQVAGDYQTLGDFGIVAEIVGVVAIGGTTLSTTAGKSNDDFSVGITGDCKVHEI